MAIIEPTEQALRVLIEDADPAAYAATRNHLTGAVTHLSPFLTHGLITLPDLIARIGQRTPLGPTDKLYSEFAWREFYQQVWWHLGEGVFEDIRPPLPGISYSPHLPEDIRRGATGLAVIDQAVRTLYATGYLHNHARLWLASYVVHFRKVHWRAGADWLYGHLLDGDLASNHLSWQWVAGTFSPKPYLFNAENVAKFAPRQWHISGSALDQSYEVLEGIARSPRGIAPQGGPGVDEPPLLPAPDLPPAAWPDDTVELIHPWCLGQNTGAGPSVAVLHAPFHARFPWSQRRWDFVLGRMRQVCSGIVVGDLSALLAGKKFTGTHTLNPGYGAALAGLPPPPRLLPWPPGLCDSFSKFWRAVTSGAVMHRH
jgi:deoxyribodipyrimidine photo-lyase